RERRNSTAPEPGQRGQGLALGRAGAAQEAHEPLDPPPDDVRGAGPHDVLDGGPTPLTRVNTTVDRNVAETRIGATRGGQQPSPDIVTGTVQPPEVALAAAEDRPVGSGPLLLPVEHSERVRRRQACREEGARRGSAK